MRRVGIGTESHGEGGTEDACGGWPEVRLASVEEPALVPHTSLLPLAGAVLALLGSCKLNILNDEAESDTAIEKLK